MMQLCALNLYPDRFTPESTTVRPQKKLLSHEESLLFILIILSYVELLENCTTLLYKNI